MSLAIYGYEVARKLPRIQASLKRRSHECRTESCCGHGCFAGDWGGDGPGVSDRGYRVVANSRSIKPESRPTCLRSAGDIGEPAVAERVISARSKSSGGVDTLINNAGIFIGKPFTEYTEDDFTRKISVNVAGFFYVTQSAFGKC